MIFFINNISIFFTSIVDFCNYTTYSQYFKCKKLLDLVPRLYRLPVISCINLHIVSTFLRESGVRNLQKHIERIYRKAAMKIVSTTEPEVITVSPDNLEDFVGKPKVCFTNTVITGMVQINFFWVKYISRVKNYKRPLTLGQQIPLELTPQFSIPL